ncbi:hypothetical protein [Actinomadura sp. WMMB 499]|uniref:hypothetical protein n=1 Tax=Actinomadura sp. WMMB 499 TaxID=1219491 RepID=UPI00124599AE|nr:hypothetical protein [Actinomadura sp. WMMB 499]QFG22596.1 hypothetical protein F7P10_17190 [Actinomadura sp. WMMB 499]
MTPQGTWHPTGPQGKRTRARDIARCTAGLLRFATPGEADALLGHLAADRVEKALQSHGTPNRVVVEALLRRGRPGDLDTLVTHALMVGDPPSLLGRLLDLDSPEVNETFLGADTALTRLPRNLRRQLAHQTSRHDGTTPRPLPVSLQESLLSGKVPDALDHALLYTADPDLAGAALRFVGAGADPHGAVQACRTLLDARRHHEIRDLVERGRLPAFRWGPGKDVPSPLAYAQAALRSAEGERALRELSERVRRAEFLRTIAEIADADACAPGRTDRSVIRTVVHRRHPGIPRVGWADVLADEPRRRAAEGPFPLRAARFMAKRTDMPLELERLLAADHPGLAVFLPDPAPEVLADLCALGPVPGADVILKVAGNGLIAGTLTPEFVAATVPEETLRVVAESLWLPGMRGTAQIRAILGLAGDVPLAPPFVDETGHGRTRRLRVPGRAAHWEAGFIYGSDTARLFERRGGTTADEVLAAANADQLLAPAAGAAPDPRVLRRLAEHVDLHLGGRPEAWLVALRLLEDGFVGTLPELLATAGAVTS